MKRVLAASVLVLLTFWFGYLFGYHHGIRDEERAWESTGHEVRDTDGRSHGLVFSNPHYFFKVSGPLSVKNVPDLRNTPVK
jgi:hypothetical protein